MASKSKSKGISNRRKQRNRKRQQRQQQQHGGQEDNEGTRLPPNDGKDSSQLTDSALTAVVAAALPEPPLQWVQDYIDNVLEPGLARLTAIPHETWIINFLMQPDIRDSGFGFPTVPVSQVEVDKLLQRILIPGKYDNREMSARRMRKLMPEAAVDLVDGKLHPQELANKVELAHLLTLPDYRRTPYTLIWDSCRTQALILARRMLGTAIVQDAVPPTNLTGTLDMLHYEVFKALHTITLNYLNTWPQDERSIWNGFLVRGQITPFFRLLPCPVSFEEFVEIGIRLSKKAKGEVRKVMHECSLKADLIRTTTLDAAWAVAQQFDQQSFLCWECGRPCEVTVYTCTLCNAANYCGENCQSRAWELGHRWKCSSLGKKFQRMNSSLPLLETGPGFQDLVVHKSQDSAILGAAFLWNHKFKGHQSNHNLLKELKGPSLVYFYENLRRIQVDGWWIHDMIFPSVKDFLRQKTRGWEAQISEDTIFSVIADWLCYDVVRFFSALATNYSDAQVSANVPAFLASLSGIEDPTFVCMTLLCMAPTGLNGNPMSGTRFLEIYRDTGPTGDATGRSGASARRACKKPILYALRTFHHK